MKSTTKQSTTRKATKNRITALLLALLLVTTILSPQISVKAQNTATEYADTTENDSDRDSGGHRVERPSGGHQTDGSTSDDDIQNADAYFCIKLLYTAGDTSVFRSETISLIGEGHFTVRTAKVRSSTLLGYYNIYYYIFSDCPFEISSHTYLQRNRTNGVIKEYTGTIGHSTPKSVERYFSNGLTCYFLSSSLGMWGSSGCTDFTLSAPYVIEFIDEPDLDSIVCTIDPSIDNGVIDDSSDGGGNSDDSSDDGDNGNDSSDSGNNVPDFDIDFSNILTLISSIVKALLKFITFILSLLLDTLTTLLSEIGQFSSLMGNIFSFLPESIFSIMLSGIVIVVFVGILRK